MTDLPSAADGVAALVASRGLGVVLLDGDGAALWSNETLREWFGVGDVGSEPHLPRLEPLLGEEGTRQLVGDLRAGKARVLRSVPTDRSGTGATRFLDIELVPLPSGGAIRGALIATDVTVRVEERSRAELFYTSFLTSNNPIEVTDRSGVMTDVNPAFVATYGYTREECIGRRPSLVRGRTTPPELYDRMWADLLDPARGHWSGELMNRDRKGRERPVFLTITAIRDESGTPTHFVGVAVNLAEQKTWERKAEHSEKLASLGQMAAGVAHEINTPLANVMLITESLRRRTHDAWVQQRLDRITGQVEVAGTIVRGLLDFARRGEPRVRRVELAEVAGAAVEFLRGKQSANIEFVEHWPAEALPVWGDRGQLVQVFTNLLNNACEALGGTGRVTVEARRMGPDVEVVVSDNGPGIPASAMPHLFEPFFTTKPEGLGTGLGLAVCAGIVQAHHGTITARNGRDGGAAFSVVLPVSTAEPPPPLSGSASGP
ncbi:MAG: ATP-binding protein [Thermoplasmata archaeon]|nr:ATP-binding protein [Thermoplasmata archaeon]